jgi:hypothetical protein
VSHVLAPNLLPTKVSLIEEEVDKREGEVEKGKERTCVYNRVVCTVLLHTLHTELCVQLHYLYLTK